MVTKKRTGGTRLQAEDFMDTGSCIQLTVDIDEQEVWKFYVKSIFHYYFV